MGHGNSVGVGVRSSTQFGIHAFAGGEASLVLYLQPRVYGVRIGSELAVD